MDCRVTPKQRSCGVHKKAYAGGPLEAAMRGAQVGSVAVRVSWPSTMDVSPSSPPGFLGANFVRLGNAVLLHEQDSARLAEPSAPPSGLPNIRTLIARPRPAAVTRCWVAVEREQHAMAARAGKCRRSR